MNSSRVSILSDFVPFGQPASDIRAAQKQAMTESGDKDSIEIGPQDTRLPIEDILSETESDPEEDDN